MQVRDIMTPNPACCTPDTTLQEIARMMEQNDCGLIPVVESHSNMRPVGTITDRDIAIRAVAKGSDGATMTAADIMTTGVATITPEMGIEECFDVMENREIRRVLVIDNRGRVCGIVAQADIVQAPTHPARTNRVIREISESAPSQNRGATNYRGGGGGFSSYMSASTLTPLLIGLGSGLALSYWMSGRSNRQFSRDYHDTDYSGYSYAGDRAMNTTGAETFGRYPDAEQEIENRRHHLEDRVHTLRSELDTTTSATGDIGGGSLETGDIGGLSNGVTDDDITTTNRRSGGRGRSAGHSGS